MYAKLLVPVSFEAERDAARAVEVARALADDGATITLVHALEPIPPSAAYYLPADHAATARTEARAALDRLAEGVPGASAEVITGHAARAILDWVHDHDVDCIVIASHRPGMQDLLLGSTATHVVRHARCAVHVVR
jgi:nucleotide-binding universal stress UspA family protein